MLNIRNQALTIPVCKALSEFIPEANDLVEFSLEGCSFESQACLSRCALARFNIVKKDFSDIGFRTGASGENSLLWHSELHIVWSVGV